MLRRMTSNNLDESSFVGIADQIQCYGHIGMYNATAVSNTARNRFMHRSTKKMQISCPTANTKQPIKKKNRCLFHGLTRELQITLAMLAMEDAQETTTSNNDNLEQAGAMQLLK